MPFDFSPDFQTESSVVPARRARGRVSYHAGLAAEEAVCRRYLTAGYAFVASRKRCPEGEIDLLMRRGGELVAVEVKASATHELAWEHATPAQLRRVSLAAERCMLDMAGDGICDMRLDLALVDQRGEIAITEGIFLG
ncbi:MAG: YraN family protein [Paracoccaceae bacterium]